MDNCALGKHCKVSAYCKQRGRVSQLGLQWHWKSNFQPEASRGWVLRETWRDQRHPQAAGSLWKPMEFLTFEWLWSQASTPEKRLKNLQETQETSGNHGWQQYRNHLREYLCKSHCAIKNWHACKSSTQIRHLWIFAALISKRNPHCF